ncbi:MAG TPA: nucleotide exchange factor GrpE [Anaerolineales bacterium]|nr:nucleotide exchange factor GrpE [Anaerolineales bacterium]
MTDKKKDKQEEMNAEAVAQSPREGMTESTEPRSAQIEALEKQLAEAQSRASEYKDGWMRSQAEFQNYRKRIERDNEIIYSSMKGDIIKKVLPILDDLERALQNRPSDSGAWVSGIELIQKKLLSILEAEGVRKIEAQGAAFDPNFHEAISHEPADGFESGHVIAVVQNGYTLGERVIRPALVRVAQ